MIHSLKISPLIHRLLMTQGFPTNPSTNDVKQCHSGVVTDIDSISGARYSGCSKLLNEELNLQVASAGTFVSDVETVEKTDSRLR